MSNTGWSKVAVQIDNPRDVADRTAPIFGIVLHTTGSGLAKLWKKRGKPGDLLEFATAFYANPENYAPHYLIGHDGTIVQIANEKEKMPHVGTRGPKGENRREQYLSGEWKSLVSPVALNEWQLRWVDGAIDGKSYKSPFHLFPGASVNNVYVGVENIPVTGTDAIPAGPRLRFTMAQHDANIRLAVDIAIRNHFPKGWARSPRLVGHEDVGFIDRHDKGGGWDCGALRARPYFDFNFVRLGCRPSDLVLR
jgi:hypothetical protein